MLLLVIARAHAHGGPPSALEIVAANADRPSVVVLNEGLALEREGRFSYLCPRLWGDADTSSGKVPLARSIDGVESFIVGADDLYIARDGVLTPQGRPESSSASIIALAGDRDVLLALRLESTGSAVVRIDRGDDEELFTSSEFWSALALANERVMLARVSEKGEFVRLVLDRRGRVEHEFRTAIEGVQPQVSLRPAGERLFAVLSGASRYTLGEIDADRWHPLMTADGPIDGPQASASGALWVALDGELMRVASGGFESAGDARRVTCLGAWGALAYACAGSDIYRLTDAGLGERLFQLEGFEGPDPKLVPEAAARECEYQWLLFKNDLERTGYAPRDFRAVDAGAPSAPAPIGGAAPVGTGCSIAALRAGAVFPAAWAWTCLALLATRRRRELR